jgi:hypothetical protein
MLDMKNKNILRILVFVCSFGLSIAVKGQNVTYSPYSIFGIGEIENYDYGRNLGMGGVGIGLKSLGSLNRVNPASYSGIDSFSFTLETSLSARSSNFYDGVNRQKNILAGLKKMALGFQVSRYWQVSAGIIPFSNMGYDITTTKTMDGAPNIPYKVNLTGNGSINRFYLGNSIKLNQHISLGVNISFLFGTLTQNETVSSAYLSSNSTAQTTTYLHRIYMDYGFQYSNTLKNGWGYIVGGIFGFKNNLNLNRSVVFSSTSGEDAVTEGNYNSYFTLPFYYGVGFSLTNKTGFTLASDYIFQKWSDVKSKTKAYSYVNSNRFSVGIEYTPAVRIPRNYFQRMFYQAGFNYTQSYLKLRGVQINQMGVSAGAGFPIKFGRSYLCFSYEQGVKGKIGHDLMRENYNQLNFTLVLRDIWFLKSKFD